MKQWLIALCLALSIAPISKAGEASHLELIGFSKNGAYVAFDQFGILDGMKFPYIITSFVSVKNNRLETEIKSVIDVKSAAISQVRAKTKAQVAAAMKKYGIARGSQGRFIGITPPHTLTTASLFFALDRTYGLSIDTKPAVDETGLCSQTPKPQLLIVKLTVDGTTRDLQRDTRLPGSRDCAYGYELRSAHLYGRSLAVFVTYENKAFDLVSALARGFEVPESRWMVVTGML